MWQYLDHSIKILSDDCSVYKPNRTGIDSISLFGYQNEYDLKEGFPLLTTKKVKLTSIIHELIWFLRGDTNIKYLVDNNVDIWTKNALQYNWSKLKERSFVNSELKLYSDEWNNFMKEYVQRIKEDNGFAQEFGNLGEVYGKQWRHWKTSDGKEIDQLANVIELLRNNQQSRRMIITAWNPEEVPNMALPPCHCFYQLNVADGGLDLILHQRSCDMFLGVPFNIASYAMLTQILAQEAELIPRRFIHTFGDAHFYCGAGERGKFYGEALQKLKKQVKNITGLEDFQNILIWINENAPIEYLIDKPITKPEGLYDHITAIIEQLSREPRSLPCLRITKKSLDTLTVDDFLLENYNPYPAIKRAMAV